jgi:hypothetical protein
LRELHQVYAGDDFEMIGVHTPEFDFEKDTRAVQAALKEHDLRYPVAIDNDWTVWRAYENRYWPALYLIDKQGYVRAHHAGELHQGTPAWDEWTARIEALALEP